jgi:hypothetical protein
MKAALHRLYCDESGNTGPRLLQTDQPFFVYAFVLLTPKAVKTIHREVVRFYSEEGIQIEDLKSSDLWSSSRGMRRYERIGTLLAQSGALVYFSIVEKRYQACVLIVETFLDPAYNPSAPGAELLAAWFAENQRRIPALTNDEVRQAAVAEAVKYNRWLAEQLFACLDDEMLDRFLAAQKADDVPRVRIVGDMVAKRLMLHHNDLTVDAGRRILKGLDDFFRFGERIPGAPINIHLPAGQQAAFVPGLVYVNRHLRSVNIPATLVCDEDRQFGEVLKHAFEQECNRAAAPYAWQFGHTESLTHITDIEQVTSDNSFGVQLADLAAGLVNRVAVAKVQNRRLTVHQRRVLAAWRPTFAALRNHFFMASNTTLLRVRRMLFFD